MNHWCAVMLSRRNLSRIMAACMQSGRSCLLGCFIEMGLVIAIHDKDDASACLKYCT